MTVKELKTKFPIDFKCILVDLNYRILDKSTGLYDDILVNNWCVTTANELYIKVNCQKVGVIMETLVSIALLIAINTTLNVISNQKIKNQIKVISDKQFNAEQVIDNKLQG